MAVKTGGPVSGTDSMNNLLDAWASWRPEHAPFVLNEDRSHLVTSQTNRGINYPTRWSDVYKGSNFAAPGDTELELGLLPHPFMGNVKDAKIYILLLNPGLSPSDYYAEFEVPRFLDIALANLKQQFSDDVEPFYCLDPQFSWHAGFTWWHGKFAKVIQELSIRQNVSYRMLGPCWLGALPALNWSPITV